MVFNRAFGVEEACRHVGKQSEDLKCPSWEDHLFAFRSSPYSRPVNLQPAGFVIVFMLIGFLCACAPRATEDGLQGVQPVCGD